MANNDGRFLDDSMSLEALIDQMAPAEREDYQDMRALAMEASFPNRRMIIYTLRDGLPTDISMLLMGDMEMTRTGGPTITVTDEKGSSTVGVRPTRWRDHDVFLHVPQNFVFKWKGKDVAGKGVQFVPHYGLLIKTWGQERHQVEGHTYCVRMNIFSERFPKVPLRY